MACQFQILAYASRPALGWTLASFVDTGIRVRHLEQQAACECSFCAGTGGLATGIRLATYMYSALVGKD